MEQENINEKIFRKNINLRLRSMICYITSYTLNKSFKAAAIFLDLDGSEFNCLLVILKS